MRKCIISFLLLFSSSALANVIDFDKVIVSSLNILEELSINSHNSQLNYQESASALGFNKDFLIEHNNSNIVTALSYDKVLLDTSHWTQDNEQYDLQHYIHMSKKNFLNKSESTWLSSGAGVTLFESNNQAFDDKKVISFSLGFHSNIPLSSQAMLSFSSKIFANYFDNKTSNECEDITCIVSDNDSVWLQKSVALNLIMSF